MPSSAYYSADMVRNLPDDGNRYETVHGELLMTPAPRAWHQELCGRIYVALRNYVKQDDSGVAYFSPADISWSDDVLVQPDVFVVKTDEARSYEWANMKTLLLAVEVISPSSRKSDRFAKRKLYQEVGVPLYWIVDPEAELVEVWTPEMLFPEVETDTLHWQPDGRSRLFELDVNEFFRR